MFVGLSSTNKNSNNLAFSSNISNKKLYSAVAKTKNIAVDEFVKPNGEKDSFPVILKNVFYEVFPQLDPKYRKMLKVESNFSTPRFSDIRSPESKITHSGH